MPDTRPLSCLLFLVLGHAGARAQDPASRTATYETLLANVPAGRLTDGFGLGGWSREGYDGGAADVVAEVQGSPRRLYTGPVRRRFTRRDQTAAVLVEMQVSRSPVAALACLSSVVVSSAPARGVRRVDEWLKHLGSRDHVLFVPETGAGPTSDRGSSSGDTSASRPVDAGARGGVAWAIFKVHNIVVRIRRVPVGTNAGLPATPAGSTDVWDLAVALGTALTPLPEVATVSAPGEPTIGLRDANGEAAPRCAAGGSLQLDLPPESVAPGHLIQWIIGGEGHGYVEKDEQGVRRLWTTGDGTLVVTVVVTNPMGLSSAHTRLVEVTDPGNAGGTDPSSRPGK